jgi:hypothetical protein
VTDMTPAQPLTRRERRQLEEQQGLLPGAPLAAPAESQVSGDTSATGQTLTPTQPATPMTRRERKMLEETGVIPIPAEYVRPVESLALQDTSLMEVTQSAPASPTPVPAEPLPPVFGLPTTSPSPEETAPAPAPIPPSFTSPIRIVGEVTMATSSLILPTTPTVDMSGPVGDTGEVIVTGQITLPHRLAETGTIPAMREDRDDDERFDAYVTGELAAMSQPIRAVKAVSGQGDEGDILLVRRVRWGTAAILTATGAAVLGIGAVVLLVVALLTDTLV